MRKSLENAGIGRVLIHSWALLFITLVQYRPVKQKADHVHFNPLINHYRFFQSITTECHPIP